MTVKGKQLRDQFGKITGMFLICAASMFIWSAQADANMAMRKLYKEAFPEAKVKCIFCHVIKMPKKDAASLNEYGEKILGEDGEVTVESITAAGEVSAE